MNDKFSAFRKAHLILSENPGEKLTAIDINAKGIFESMNALMICLANYSNEKKHKPPYFLRERIDGKYVYWLNPNAPDIDTPKELPGRIWSKTWGVSTSIVA